MRKGTAVKERYSLRRLVGMRRLNAIVVLSETSGVAPSVVVNTEMVAFGFVLSFVLLVRVVRGWRVVALVIGVEIVEGGTVLVEIAFARHGSEVVGRVWDMM